MNLIGWRETELIVKSGVRWLKLRGMPTVLRVAGYRFFFYSREGLEPRHIHVEQAERYAKFWLTPVSLATTRGFRSSELTELSRLVAQHRAFFEEKWYEHLRNQG